MVGGAWALKQNSSTNILYLMMAMVGAIAAHVAVNTLNDYFDFKSGLDLLTKPTPFSGGSGMLPGEKLKPKTVLALGLGSLAVAVAVGTLFIAIRGWELLIITVPAGLLIILYTQYITRFPWLCLMVPGVAFGPLMATGAFYALSGTFNTTVLAASKELVKSEVSKFNTDPLSVYFLGTSSSLVPMIASNAIVQVN